MQDVPRLLSGLIGQDADASPCPDFHDAKRPAGLTIPAVTGHHADIPLAGVFGPVQVCMYILSLFDRLATGRTQRVTPDADWLRKQYREEKKRPSVIAEMCGCTSQSVKHWLRKHDIPLWDSMPQYPELLNEGWLREMHWGEESPATEIADMIGCSADSVYRWMERLGIERRQGAPEPKYGEEHHSYVERIDLECHHCGNSFTRIPWECGDYDRQFCTRDCHIEWLREEYVGERHHLYNGGPANYGVGWDDEKKEAVRERDNHSCQICGQSQEEHLEACGKRLNVHHITPAKNFGDPERRNAMDNLITLCLPCHRKAEQMAPLLPAEVA